MEAFLTNISSFPTVVYTVMVLVMSGFWLLNLTGLFNFDSFDIDADLDVDADNIGTFTTILINLGLTGVPFTLVLTLLNLFSWVICYYAVHFGLALFEPSLVKTILAVVIFIASFAMALPITAYAIQPLRKIFVKLNDEGSFKTLLGETCTIRTSRVDSDFGEAECSIDGLSHIIKVRTHSPHPFKHGDKAVVVEHDKDLNVYFIVSETEFNH